MNITGPLTVPNAIILYVYLEQFGPENTAWVDSILRHKFVYSQRWHPLANGNLHQIYCQLTCHSNQ